MSFDRILVGFVSIVIIAVAAIFVFVPDSTIIWEPDTLIWSHYGSFMAAFLLAITLFYQIRAYKRQQVEAKFFELIKYYRENLNEMKFRNPFYYTYKDEKGNEKKVEEEFVSGRRVVKTIFEQYKAAVKVVDHLIKKECKLEFRDREKFTVDTYIFQLTNEFYKKNIDDGRDIEHDKWIERLNLNEVAYLITFWGIPLDIDQELKKYIRNIVTEPDILSRNIQKLLTTYELDQSKDVIITYRRKLRRTNEEFGDFFDKARIKEDKIKFFGGHQYHLGHFFRHLYQAVKYIDKQPGWILNFSEKYDYVKTLRAQMSNYEQALLFINSLTEIGRKWEYEHKLDKKPVRNIKGQIRNYKDKKDLISKYNLITNLPQFFIPRMEPQFYYPNVEFEWKNMIASQETKEETEKPEIKQNPKPDLIRMGNDEFILYIRKKSQKCKLTNDQLGQKIWEWLEAQPYYAAKAQEDAVCYWGDKTKNTAPDKLPKTATQFEFDRCLLPALYEKLDELVMVHNVTD